VSLFVRGLTSRPGPSKATRFNSEPLKSDAARWRTSWETSSRQSRNDGLMMHLASCLKHGAHGRETCQLRFLGVPLCKRAFRRITRINPYKFAKLVSRGAVSFQPRFINKPHPRYDEMYAAIDMKVQVLAQSSPFRHDRMGQGPTVIELPFHEKIFLFRMILIDYEAARQRKERTPIFSKRPQYSTFRRVLGDPHFSNLRFHRVVDIGRCSKCCYLRWKCMVTPPGPERDSWRNLAAVHQNLQLEQKKVVTVASTLTCQSTSVWSTVSGQPFDVDNMTISRLRQLQVYAADRAKAAVDFPASELYLAFDGGSGFEFWLPHISPHGSELPNKGTDKAHTSPVKVMNGHVCGSGCIFIRLHQVSDCVKVQPTHKRAQDWFTGTCVLMSSSVHHASWRARITLAKAS